MAALIGGPVGKIPANNWWSLFTTVNFGGRYYFIAHIAVYMVLLWLIFSKNKVNIEIKYAFS